MSKNPRFSDRDLKILWYLQHRPSKLDDTVAKKLGIQLYTIRRAIKRFEDLGAIRKMPLFSVSELGLIAYDCYLSLQVSKASLRKQFASVLVKHPKVSRVHEIGGDYELNVELIARHPRELIEFWDEIAAEFGDIVFQKRILIRDCYYGFGRKYFTDRNVDSIISLGERVADEQIDSTDDAILRAVSENPTSSLRLVAKSLGMHHSTLDSRLKKLGKRGIFRGYIYAVRSQLFGRHKFRVFIQAPRASDKMTQSLSNFCRQHSDIVNLVRYLGEWDYSMLVETPSAAEVVSVIQDLKVTFSEEIASIHTIPLFYSLKNVNYPLYHSEKNL